MGESTRKGRPADDEVREIVAGLLVERSNLLSSGETAEAEAIKLAIEYWQKVLAEHSRG
jgi:hypothetical protein